MVITHCAHPFSVNHHTGRLFVERSIHDEFISRMIAEVKKMKIGDPLDRSTAHGPQNHKYVQTVVFITDLMSLNLG